MKNVMPVLEFYVSSMYHLLHGVADYAREHDWHLFISSRFELPRRWSGDGILTHITDSPPLLEFLQRHADIPIISFNAPWWGKYDLPYAVVSEDNEEIGRIAARYLLTLGYENYCWYGQSPSRNRYVTFADELAKSNRQPDIIIFPSNLLNCPWDDISGWLMMQLKQLKLPCAIFCENDTWARELLETALQGGFRIPQDIAIMGVDNETLICESVSAPLSSIDSRLGRVGYEGAALLDRLMDGEPLPTEPILVPPVPLPIVRKSTDILATGNDIVSRAVEFIRKNHTTDITVADISRKVCISDSGLRKLMNRKIGTSPRQLLQDMRVETACRLLRETNLKIESIAIQSGFCDCQSFHSLFRQALQTTPLRFRQESRR